MLVKRMQVAVPVVEPDVASAASRLAAARDEVGARRPRTCGDLRLHVRPDGRVRVWRVSERYTCFPVLYGRLDRGEDGRVTLRATARENYAPLVILGCYLFGVLIMLVGLASSVADGNPGGAGFFLIGAILLGVVAWMWLKDRRLFPGEVEELVGMLRGALGQGARADGVVGPVAWDAPRQPG